MTEIGRRRKILMRLSVEVSEFLGVFLETSKSLYLIFSSTRQPRKEPLVHLEEVLMWLYRSLKEYQCGDPIPFTSTVYGTLLYSLLRFLQASWCSRRTGTVPYIQCFGSGSTCFWASWIQIHSSEVWIQIRLRIWILLTLCKNSKKNLNFTGFLTSF